jgi:hypothetical protein
MKKRYIYTILFGIPGFMISALIAWIVAGTAAGALWIFVFGDNPWPASVDKILPVLLVVVFLAIWIVLLTAGFLIGKRLERHPEINKNHIWISIGVVVAIGLGFGLFQLRAGNIGPQSEGARCSEYCSQKGYSASSMPPLNSGDRTCSCLDEFGNAVITVPLENIGAAK